MSGEDQAGRSDEEGGNGFSVAEVVDTIRWWGLWARSLRHAEVARVREEFDARWRQVIADAVVEGQAAGEFAPVDPLEFATAMSALLDGLAVQLVLGDPAIDPGVASRITMDFASSQLGFAWARPEPVTT